MSLIMFAGFIAMAMLPLVASGQDDLQPQPVPVVVQAPDVSVDVDSAVDPADLNLWRNSGRARILVDPETRELLHTVEIVDRPGRPLHFYGNTVRRRAYGLGWNLSNR